MLIQQSNWITRARKAAGAKGPAQTDLLEDVNQMVQVADLDTYEFDFLGGVKRCVASANVPAVAAQPSYITIQNPPGSGFLAFLYKIEITLAAALTCTEEVTSAQTTVLPQIVAFQEDFRFGIVAAGPFATCIVQAGAPAAIFAATQVLTRLVNVAATPQEYTRRWVLPPGSQWLLRTPVNNTITSVNIFWKERPAESGELGLGTS